MTMRDMDKVTLWMQPEYRQNSMLRDEKINPQRIDVDLRELRETLDFIQKTADQHIAEGGNPRLLIVDVRTYISLKCRGLEPKYGLNTEIVCGDFLSEEPKMVIVDERGYEYSARLLFKEKTSTQELAKRLKDARAIRTEDRQRKTSAPTD